MTADNIEYDLDSEDDDDEGEDDDDGFPDYSPEQLRQYALDLAMTMKIGVARNRDQRLDIATEFMQTTGVKMREYDVACVAQQGLNLYEVKVLPERVKKLNDLLDTYHSRLQKLQTIVARRHNVATK